MSDLKLFAIDATGAHELKGTAMPLEKSLQALLEKHMEAFFGVRFLASEYSTGKKHGGRIDSLGLDENGTPVIFEYKRSTNENVINQGLFYLDWLLDHRAEFQLLTLDRLDKEAADNIDWSRPRLVCVAGDFTKYDQYAVLQIDRNIELVRYRNYSGEYLALELLTSTGAQATAAGGDGGSATSPAQVSSKSASGEKTAAQLYAQAPQHVRDLYDAVEELAISFGDDVTKKVLKFYFAFRRLRNFACVEVHPQAQKIVVYARVVDTDMTFEPGFTRNMKGIGHYGTGDLEITLKSIADLERARPLLEASYDGS
ncbi:DUF5655 domain-containing protein [Kineococcus terrestris]|uniref:DUF5655 domain-containing protein n=1 Tax=Kineococcus terrestris TaxID=2044856 RepID=UPI0034DAFFBF